MVKLFAAFAVLGALTAGVFVTPIQGRTIADRWSAAPTPSAFATGVWDEGRRVVIEGRRAATADRRELVSAPSPLTAPSRRGAAPRATGSPKPMPTEHHTPEDRAALDRLLSERSQ